MINIRFLDTSPRCCRSALGAGIIAGAGSLIGGLFSSHGSRDAARYQLQAARETNQTNRDIAEQNYHPS